MTSVTARPRAKSTSKKTSSATRSQRPKPEELVADKIIELLDSGDLPPWARPWRYSNLGAAHNALTKKQYRGINTWLLALSTSVGGYVDPRWLTFKQAQNLGGNVKKGEKSTWIVFWKIIRKTKSDQPDDNVEVFDQENPSANTTQSFPMARIYHVFNAEQTDGCKLPALEQEPSTPHNPIEEAEIIVANMPYPPDFETYLQGNLPPHYIPTLDKVRVPDISRYNQPEMYYNSVFHELVHSTGHEKRLQRFESVKIGREDLHQYAAEELVAGMGAAMLTSKAGLEHVTIQADASYIKYWADRIRADKSIIMTSAQRAQRAVDYISPPSPGHEQEADPHPDEA